MVIRNRLKVVFAKFGGLDVKRYRLIAIDIDGTLLDSRHKVSKYTKEIIQRAVNEDITVTLSTGRMFRSAQMVADEIELDVPLITYNGALVKNSASGEIYSHQTIDPDVGDAMMCLLEKRELHYHVYIDECLYVPKLTEKTKIYAKRSGVRTRPLSEVSLRDCSGASKFLVMGDPDKLDETAIFLQEELGDHIRAAKSHPIYLEIVHSKASKGGALERLAKELTIPREAVMALGDQQNDLDMIRFAGLGIAMKNAAEELKFEADYIAGSNDEDGAAKAIASLALELDKKIFTDHTQQEERLYGMERS